MKDSSEKYALVYFLAHTVPQIANDNNKTYSAEIWSERLEKVERETKYGTRLKPKNAIHRDTKEVVLNEDFCISANFCVSP